MSYAKLNSGAATAAKMSAYDVGLRSYMISVYKYMSMALGLTGIVALSVASSPEMMAMLFSGPMLWVLILAPFELVMFMSARYIYMSVSTVKICLFAYASLIGVSMAALFMVYTGTSIARTFFITSSVFGIMSIYGYSTKKDLTGFGSFMIMGLIGIIIASVVNLFMQSSAMNFIVSALGVVIFAGLTAYETQKIKSIYYQVANDASAAEKVAIFGALGLYMDFINLFVKMLYFFGDRRN